MRGARSILAIGVGLLLLGTAARSACAAEGDPLLWVVDTEPRIFLVGTLHVGDPELAAFHPLVQKAFDVSGRVLTELDFREDIDGQAQARACLPRGRCLRRMLPPRLYRRATNAALAAGHSLPCLDCRKVWVVYLLLDAATCTPGGHCEPLDRRIHSQALAAGKRVGGLETVDEQLSVFDDLVLRDQVDLLGSAIRRIEGRRRAGLPLATDRGATLRALYLAGDAEGIVLEAERLLGCRDDLQYRLVRALFHVRNERMVHRVLARAGEDTETPLFVAVGAAHLGGQRGMVARLKARGLPVHRVRDAADLVLPVRGPAPTRDGGSATSEGAEAVAASAANDGAAKDGAAKDGAAKDGAAKDGAAKDGAAKDGAAKDGAATDSEPNDSKSNDATPEDEPVDGAPGLPAPSQRRTTRPASPPTEPVPSESAPSENAPPEHVPAEGGASDASDAAPKGDPLDQPAPQKSEPAESSRSN